MGGRFDPDDLDEIDMRLGAIIDGAEVLIADVEAGQGISRERLEKVIGDAEALDNLLPEDEDGEQRDSE